MPDHEFRAETLAIHAGQIPDAATGARALPIYQTTSFVFDSADHAASLFNLQTFGNVYSRLSNPTVAALEERVAALEGGRAAVASASGMAAEAMALMTLLQQGDHVVAAGALYGGTVTMLAVNLKKFGVETSFVDATDPSAFAAAIRPNTRAIFAESLGNPSLAVLDIAAVAEVAHAHGLPLVIDNTVPSPFLCQPIRHGADIVVHSATKYLSGHSDALAGIAVARRPDDATAIAAARTLRGATPGMLEAFLALRGLRTLALRMTAATANAADLAARLAGHPAVQRVYYPGLPTDPGHELAASFMTGFGAVVSFEVAGGAAAADRVCTTTRLIRHATSLGGVESTLERRASVPGQEHLPPGLIRVSVGAEDPVDLWRDLASALAA
jgi:O-acetylhomoserine (thiol)-lyase